jgi:hypothetical protein
MPIHVEWGTSDHTLLLWRVVSELTLEHYQDAARKTSLCLKSAVNPITIVIDVRKCHHTSHNLIPIMRDQIHYLQNFQGELIVLSKTQFWQSMYQVAARSSIGVRLPNIRFQITQDENSDILATL